MKKANSKSKILITGGAGYIGSHVVKQLLETTQHNITILDNLSTGSTKTLDTLGAIREFKFIQLDLKEFEKVADVLTNGKFDTIIHFAASIVVPESVENPIKYYMNNTVNTTNLISCAVNSNVKRFIFSSTAAVYGEPTDIPQDGIDENYPTNPINPYGMSKLMSERVLQDTANANEDFKFVIFRYFNVAGADIHYNNSKLNIQNSKLGDLSPRIGQSFPNATHLIKIASQCASGSRKKMAIFGDDFDTSDGTGHRDYIHVDDLASAHIKAIEYLETNSSDIFNAGYGSGFSVKEVIEYMKAVTNTNFQVDIEQRRAGDPASLVSNNSKIKNQMNWTPRYNDLALICKSSFEWEKSEK
jgi:UDP-glucose 4-epimerase